MKNIPTWIFCVGLVIWIALAITRAFIPIESSWLRSIPNYMASVGSIAFMAGVLAVILKFIDRVPSQKFVENKLNKYLVHNKYVVLGNVYFKTQSVVLGVTKTKRHQVKCKNISFYFYEKDAKFVPFGLGMTGIIIGKYFILNFEDSGPFKLYEQEEIIL